MNKPISNIEVYGLEKAIKASKYPMLTDTSKATSDITNTTKKLFSAPIGSGHDSALRGIVAKFDLTFTNKAWVEAERYHFLQFDSSQSTMHRISKMDISASCCEYVTQNTINEVNRLKDIYLETKHPEDYLMLLYNVPSGFKLTAGMTTNYQQLKTIYYQRKNHRLPEWRLFCKQLEEEFPMFRELVIAPANKED